MCRGGCPLGRAKYVFCSAMTARTGRLSHRSLFCGLKRAIRHNEGRSGSVSYYAARLLPSDNDVFHRYDAF